MGNILFRSILCMLPLGLTPLWGFLIAEGTLNFGGGEKDLLLLIPWLLWSLLYMVIFIVAWVKRWSLGKTVLYSFFGAGAGVVLVWLVLLIGYSGLLGVA